jgi:hypothetical protein
MYFSRYRKHSNPMMNDASNSNHIIQTYTLFHGDLEVFVCDVATTIPIIAFTNVNAQIHDATTISKFLIGSFS